MVRRLIRVVTSSEEETKHHLVPLASVNHLRPMPRIAVSLDRLSTCHNHHNPVMHQAHLQRRHSQLPASRQNYHLKMKRRSNPLEELLVKEAIHSAFQLPPQLLQHPSANHRLQSLPTPRPQRVLPHRLVSALLPPVCLPCQNLKDSRIHPFSVRQHSRLAMSQRLRRQLPPLQVCLTQAIKEGSISLRTRANNRLALDYSRI